MCYRMGKVSVTHLATGDYEVQDVKCAKCTAHLGWTYLKAFNEVCVEFHCLFTAALWVLNIHAHDCSHLADFAERDHEINNMLNFTTCCRDDSLTKNCKLLRRYSRVSSTKQGLALVCWSSTWLSAAVLNSYLQRQRQGSVQAVFL